MPWTLEVWGSIVGPREEEEYGFMAWWLSASGRLNTLAEDTCEEAVGIAVVKDVGRATLWDVVC